MEYEDLTNNLGGCFIDLMGGRFLINPLEPKVWDEGAVSYTHLDVYKRQGGIPTGSGTAAVMMKTAGGAITAGGSLIMTVTTLD